VVGHRRNRLTTRCSGLASLAAELGIVRRFWVFGTVEGDCAVGPSGRGPCPSNVRLHRSLAHSTTKRGCLAPADVHRPGSKLPRSSRPPTVRDAPSKVPAVALSGRAALRQVWCGSVSCRSASLFLHRSGCGHSRKSRGGLTSRRVDGHGARELPPGLVITFICRRGPWCRACCRPSYATW
jgi:hypothetical protein